MTEILYTEPQKWKAEGVHKYPSYILRVHARERLSLSRCRIIYKGYSKNCAFLFFSSCCTRSRVVYNFCHERLVCVCVFGSLRIYTEHISARARACVCLCMCKSRAGYTEKGEKLCIGFAGQWVVALSLSSRVNPGSIYLVRQSTSWPPSWYRVTSLLSCCLPHGAGYENPHHRRSHQWDYLADIMAKPVLQVYAISSYIYRVFHTFSCTIERSESVCFPRTANHRSIVTTWESTSFLISMRINTYGALFQPDYFYFIHRRDQLPSRSACNEHLHL